MNKFSHTHYLIRFITWRFNFAILTWPNIFLLFLCIGHFPSKFRLNFTLPAHTFIFSSQNVCIFLYNHNAIIYIKYVYILLAIISYPVLFRFLHLPQKYLLIVGLFESRFKSHLLSLCLLIWNTILPHTLSPPFSVQCCH